MKKYFFCLVFITLSSVLLAQKDSTLQTLSVTSKLPVDSSVLIVVDGIVLGTIRELKIDIRNKFPADIIASIDVLKGQRALDKYGDKGKGGVIEFYLKNVKIKEATLVDKKMTAEDSIFRKVEIEAAFTGGDRAWRSYLERTLNASVPADNYAPSGTYTTVIQFIVDKNGDISDVRPLTKLGFGMEEEVVRVISKGPTWTPAIQDGRPVKAYRKQPVTFMVINDIELSTYSITAGKPSNIEIKIDRDGIKPEDLEITLSYGTIVHDNGNKYILTVDKPGQVLLSIKQKAKKKKDEMSFGPVAIQVK